MVCFHVMNELEINQMSASGWTAQINSADQSQDALEQL